MRFKFATLTVFAFSAVLANVARAQDCEGSWRDARHHSIYQHVGWGVGATGATLVERSSTVVQHVGFLRTFDEPSTCLPLSNVTRDCATYGGAGPSTSLSGYDTVVDSGSGSGCEDGPYLGSASCEVILGDFTCEAYADGVARSIVNYLPGFGALKTEYGQLTDCILVIRTYDVVPGSPDSDLGVSWWVDLYDEDIQGEVDHRVTCGCDPITEASHYLESTGYSSFVHVSASYDCIPEDDYETQINVGNTSAVGGTVGTIYSDLFSAPSVDTAYVRVADCTNCERENDTISTAEGNGSLTGSIPGRPYAIQVIYQFTSGDCGGGGAPPRPTKYCFADFNCDGDVGTDADIDAFFAALSGGPTCIPGGTDINGDGDAGTDADIEAFFAILANGCDC